MTLFTVIMALHEVRVQHSRSENLRSGDLDGSVVDVCVLEVIRMRILPDIYSFMPRGLHQILWLGTVCP